MNLWIKAQNGNLIMPNNIQVGNVIYPYIWVFTRLENESICLGEYKTEERAFKVLNEIEKLLVGQDKLLIQTPLTDYENYELVYEHLKEEKWVSLADNSEIKYIPLNTVVYTMPKE